jgi:hypothetical protein
MQINQKEAESLLENKQENIGASRSLNIYRRIRNNLAPRAKNKYTRNTIIR